MEINITFRHEEPSNVIKDHIHKKLADFSKYFIKPVMAHVTLNAEKSRHITEISLSENHSVFNAKALTQDMYSSVNQALSKLETQLKKYKDKIKHHKRKKKRILS